MHPDRIATLLGIALSSFLPGPLASCDAQPSSEPARPTSQPAGSAPTASASAPAAVTRWTRPRFNERRAERLRMVREQIAASPDGRPPVRDERVLEAMRQVPRHLFVRTGDQPRAYGDYPLPIDCDQTISQPYIVALMTEALRLPPGGKVLEIGTATGYQAAVLSELTPHVYTIELLKPLADAAAERLRRLGYGTVRVRCGDGYFGWPEAAPFDGILVTCAAGHVPPALWEQLRPGGRMVIPLGESGFVQQLTVLTKLPDGSRRTEVLTPCAFVPMTGRIQRK